MLTADSVSDMVDDTATFGGTTVDMATGKVAGHHTGYFVGGKYPTVVIPWAEFDDNSLTTAIRGFGQTAYVGTWEYEGSVYVDAVDHTESLITAVMLGKTRGELEIFDIANNVGIVL